MPMAMYMYIYIYIHTEIWNNGRDRMGMGIFANRSIRFALQHMYLYVHLYLLQNTPEKY